MRPSDQLFTSTYAGFNLQVTIESCLLASLETWLACAMEHCSLH